jgi:hypothetical protein
MRLIGLLDGIDGRRTTFLLYKGYVHLENQKKGKTFLAWVTDNGN